MADTTPDFDIPNDSRIPEGNLKAFSAILLALLTVVSFFGNIFLIGTIASSHTLRSVMFNIFIMNLALINLLDTAINMFLSLLYIAEGQWALPHEVCMFNAAIIQLLRLESAAGIALLALDRALALLNLRKYPDRMTVTRVIVALGGVWLVGFCISVPIFIESVKVKAFPARMFCAVASESPFGYAVALLLLYILVFFIILLAFGMILFRAHQERLGQRSNLPERPADYTDFIVDNRHFYDHLELGKFAVVLFLVYFCLQGPYIILNFIVQMRNSGEILDNYNGIELKVPQDAETAITWVKFVYPVVFTFLVFGFCREIWQKFSALICCRRTSLVSMSRQNLVQDIRSDKAALEDSKVLTLVATSGGLHLRTAQIDQDGKQKEEYAFADVPDGTRRNSGVPQDAFTSDYDSEDSGRWAPEEIPNDDDLLRPRQQSAETEASQSHVQLEANEPKPKSRQSHQRSQSESVAPVIDVPGVPVKSVNRPHSATYSTKKNEEKQRNSMGSLFDDWQQENSKQKIDEKSVFKPKRERRQQLTETRKFQKKSKLEANTGENKIEKGSKSNPPVKRSNNNIVKSRKTRTNRRISST